MYYFNKKYKRKGPLVQDRFKSKQVESLQYLIDVCRYVHRNPENAGIELTQNYKWSSYKEYIGRKRLVDKGVLLHYYNDDVNKFIEDTIKNVNEKNIEDYIEYEIIGKLNDEQLAEAIVSKLKIGDISNIPTFFKNRDGEELERYIKEIKSIQGINKNQVARVTRLGRKRVDKFWNKTEPVLIVPKEQNRTGTECPKCS